MVATETLERELHARGFARMMRWSRGVDCNLYRPQAASVFDLPRPIFLTCARVAIEKNLGAFLSLELPGSKVVVGDGPARKKLQKRLSRGAFRRRDARRRARRSLCERGRIRLSELGRHFGLVLLEALASGVPVAAFPVTGPLDVIGQSGAGVLDANLGRAALAALAIPRDCARAHALNFSQRASARQFVDNVFRAQAKGAR